MAEIRRRIASKTTEDGFREVRLAARQDRPGVSRDPVLSGGHAVCPDRGVSASPSRRQPRTDIEPPPPRLQADPQRTWRAISRGRSASSTPITGSTRTGIVHIPIEEAMSVAEHGIDGFPKAALKRRCRILLGAACGAGRASRRSRTLPSDFAFQPHPGAALPLTARLATNRRARVPRGVFHRQAGRAGARISALPDLVRTDAARLDRRARRAAARRRPRFPARRVSIDPRDTPADAAAQGELPRRLPPPAGAAACIF